jgi:hypothetical protein
MNNSGEKAALETKIKNIGHQIALLEDLKAQCIRKVQVYRFQKGAGQS